MNPNFRQTIQSKIQDWNTAAKTVATWQQLGLEVVFTNGCFDLIHLGHLHYLAEAQSLGDKLVIGLNSDASIQRLKGKQRPIKEVKNRSHLLASLQMVDLVVVFEEDTPYQLIKTLEPDLLVKGGDYQPHEIVGSDIVLAKGGKVCSLEFVEGYSTTNFIEKIKKRD